MELTPNFNQNSGGFIVDPNASQGNFGVGIGIADSRNNAFFARPSAGQWHHYALVLDATAPAAQQVRPYVDGQPVSYTKTADGTGAGNFANSTLYLMSRGGQGLFGAGGLDEVAVYNRTFNAAEIAEHHASHGLNRRPHATLAATPNPVETGDRGQLRRLRLADPDGSIASYQWDLDGNGSFETDTGATATAKAAYAQEGEVTVTVRVRDNEAATDTESVVLTVADEEEPPPPPPAVSYSKAVAETPGLATTGASPRPPGDDSRRQRRQRQRHPRRRPTLGIGGALGGAGGGFDGSDDFAAAPVNLSGTTDLTVEFWLRWNAYADDDDLAMELTENFNANEGGLLIDQLEPRRIRRRHGQPGNPQQRLLRPAQRRRLAPLRLRLRHHRCGGGADHALRRRQSRSPSARAPAAPAPALSPTAASTSCHAPVRTCSVPARSTRSRSTTNR